MFYSALLYIVRWFWRGMRRMNYRSRWLSDSVIHWYLDSMFFLLVTCSPWLVASLESSWLCHNFDVRDIFLYLECWSIMVIIDHLSIYMRAFLVKYHCLLHGFFSLYYSPKILPEENLLWGWESEGSLGDVSDQAHSALLWWLGEGAFSALFFGKMFVMWC